VEWLFLLYHVVIILAIIHVILDCRQPAKTVAWTLMIYFVPVAGLLAYLLVGVNIRRERYVSRRSMDQLSRRQMDAFLEQLEQKGPAGTRHEPPLDLPEAQDTLINFFARQDGALPFRSHDVEFYRDGYEFFPSLLHYIAQARHHIHIDMYIVQDDALGLLLGDALIAKAQEGVEVRLVYDDVGSWKTSERYFERLRMAGIEVSAFMPVRFPIFARKVNYRNHRKIIVIDGQTAFIGGMNFATRYVKGRTQPWRDTMMRVSGPAAYSLQRAFFIDWYFVDRTLITHKRYYPSFHLKGPQPPILTQTVMHSPNAQQPMIQMGLMRIIMSARTYVYIQSPYFLPTEPVLTALKYAAGGGVDVRLMVPLHSDAPFTDWSSRAYLRQAAEAGVQVELYRSGFLHSKLLVADDEVCTVGSTNMDFRSLENNFEANTFIYNKVVARRLRNLFLQDERHAVLLARIRRRMKPSIWVRLLESVTRIIAPLL